MPACYFYVQIYKFCEVYPCTLLLKFLRAVLQWTGKTFWVQMRSDDQSLHIYQNTNNVVQLSSEELFKMLGPGEFSCGWESCLKRSFCISTSVQLHSHPLFGLSCTLSWSVFPPEWQRLQFIFCLGKEGGWWRPYLSFMLMAMTLGRPWALRSSRALWELRWVRLNRV